MVDVGWWMVDYVTLTLILTLALLVALPHLELSAYEDADGRRTHHTNML